MAICGNMVGTYSQIGKTLILEDENGNQLMGVVTDSVQILTANAATDIREGTVAVTDEGIVTGSTTIPNYETTQGHWIVMPGEVFSIPNLKQGDMYDYSFIQCIITAYSTSVDSSVCAEYVVIDDIMYATNSTEGVSVLTKNIEDKIVDFNTTNNSENIYIIRYVTYKEVI